jgi:hypothetical protein
VETLSERQLERYLADELDPPSRAQVEALLASPEAQARLQALREDGARTLAALPPAQVAAEVERRLRVARASGAALARWGGPRGRRAGGGVPAVAAAVLFAISIPRVGPQEAEPAEVTRAKGLAPHLRVYLKSAGGPRPLRDGESVHPRDVVQLATVAPGRPFAVVVSIDGAGGVTRHVPVAGGPPGASQASPPILPTAETALPRSFELDEAPGFERFFLVTGDRPFDVSLVERAARSLAQDPGAAQSRPLPLPAGLSQSSFLLRKVTP